MSHTTRPGTVLHATAPPSARGRCPLIRWWCPSLQGLQCLTDWIKPDCVNRLFFKSVDLLWSICRDALCVHASVVESVSVSVCVLASCALANNWSSPRQRPSDLINFNGNSSFDASITVILTTSSFRHWFVTEALRGPSVCSFTWRPTYFLMSQILSVHTQ